MREPLIDTDTRQLKRDLDGFYRSGAGKKPCAHCGDRAACAWVDTQVKCETFLPALPFTDELGLDRRCNTIRVGKAWTERLVIGQTVALYHAKRQTIFGHSTVLATIAGPISDILAAHARFNHLLLDTPPAAAAETLHSWLRRNYGPRIIHENTRISAIYLQRRSGEDAAPLQQG